MFTSYSVDNDRSFRRAIQRAADGLGDLRIPFGQILADFYKSERAIFSLKGPGQYPPFQGKKGKDGYTAYQRNKISKAGFDYPLLVRSGSLSASLLSAGSKGSVAMIEPLSLTIGTTIDYGKYHQSDAPRKRIPLRKFLFIGPEASQFATSEQQGRPERWMNIMNDFVLYKMKQSGAFK